MPTPIGGTNQFGPLVFRSKYPFLNPVVIIAFLIGVLQLFISHLTPDENKFWKTLTHEIGFALLVAVINPAYIRVLLSLRSIRGDLGGAN